MTTAERTTHRQQHGGPPLGVLALVSTLLFLAGLILPSVIAHGAPPAPTSSAPTIYRYFSEHRSAVRLAAFLQFGAAIPLAIYAATVSARLHNLGIRAPGATIALVGGVVSASFLAISALTTWVLSRPEIVTDHPVVRALWDFAFATGGPGHVVFLGLLLAGVAVPALFGRLLPRPAAIVGLVIAVVAQLSTLSLLNDGAAYLLPLARFPALIWLIAAGFMLPTTRARANQDSR